ncbi:MAG: hypothetical protein IJ563_00930 [Selenomonadaceae bacterium]|nr:hypothetical protein [Selenomonadaceae bacterium]
MNKKKQKNKQAHNALLQAVYSLNETSTLQDKQLRLAIGALNQHQVTTHNLIDYVFVKQSAELNKRFYNTRSELMNCIFERMHHYENLIDRLIWFQLIVFAAIITFFFIS